MATRWARSPTSNRRTSTGWRRPSRATRTWSRPPASSRASSTSETRQRQHAPARGEAGPAQGRRQRRPREQRPSAGVRRHRPGARRRGLRDLRPTLPGDVHLPERGAGCRHLPGPGGAAAPGHDRAFARRARLRVALHGRVPWDVRRARGPRASLRRRHVGSRRRQRHRRRRLHDVARGAAAPAGVGRGVLPARRAVRPAHRERRDEPPIDGGRRTGVAPGRPERSLAADHRRLARRPGRARRHRRDRGRARCVARGPRPARRDRRRCLARGTGATGAPEAGAPEAGEPREPRERNEPRAELTDYSRARATVARMTDRPDWEARRRAWRVERLDPALARTPLRQSSFRTLGEIELEPVYGPWTERDEARDIGMPGEAPFTRGIHPSGYRSRLWTMRMFAGFGAAEDTNQRFRDLLAAGQTGLSIAYDMPTLYGYDTDDEEAEGEFGTCGVGVSSLADMEVLLDGLPLARVSPSMTINSPAAPIWAMYIVAAEKAGYPRAMLEGTTQNDILKEFIAQKEFLFPPEPAMRLVTDTIEFGTKEMPRWNTVSISGYHIREAGSTAVQELAFTIADGMAYVEDAIARGLRVDDFAPRLSFFFNSHSDFFEEIAKFRASRRIWHDLMTKRYHAENERSAWMRFHTQTAGVSLTPQQPLNNLTRVALQALAGVLGGTQSLHTDAYDEALAVPTAEAASLALRQQQVIAEETGVTGTVDPLGGSWFVEALTDEVERQVWAYIDEIDRRGGMVPAITEGYPQREIADAAYRYQREFDAGERRIVGVNAYVDEREETRVPVLSVPPGSEERHLARLHRTRRERDARAVETALAGLRDAASRPGTSETNLMPHFLAAAAAYEIGRASCRDRVLDAV